MVRNVYIHIPFCKSKCKYCSFVSFCILDLKSDYLSALTNEIRQVYNNEILKTLYFGGGTPSLLTSDEFAQIIRLFNINSSTEITAELNPEQITQNYSEKLKKTQINRLSFGCQTFNNKILKEIGRRHSAKDVENAIKFAKQAGFNNISLDFIYGLPNQTIEMFEQDLNHAVSLGIQHISLYGLKIEKGSYYYKNRPKNLPDEDIQADMYLKAIEILIKNDFNHYEISNFAINGFESQHNLNYWNNNSYYGFGAAAHGYENGIRYANTTNLKKYINNPLLHKDSHKVTLQEELEEEIFLGFRKSEGINTEKINKKFNINFAEKYAEILKKYMSYGYLKETNVGFTLTKEGILVSNIILSEFLA